MSKMKTLQERYAERMKHRENKAEIGDALKAKRKSLIQQITLVKSEVGCMDGYAEKWQEQVDFHKSRFVEKMKQEAKTRSLVKIAFDADALCFFFGDQFTDKFDILANAISGDSSIDKASTLARLQGELFQLESEMFENGVRHSVRTLI